MTQTPTPTRKVERVDNRGVRWYDVEGIGLLPSVTTCLKIIDKSGPLVGWAKNVTLEKVRAELLDYAAGPFPDRDDYRTWVDGVLVQAKARPDQVRDEAADFGTLAHVAIDTFLSGDKDNVIFMQPGIDTALTNFKEWQDQAGLEITMSEQVVYSEQHRYAGTFDAIAKRGSELLVLDWKTSNGTYPEMALQAAAYAKAYEEMYGDPVSEAWVVRISKDLPEEGKPSFEVSRVADIDASFRTFLAAKDLWTGMKEKAWAEKT